MNIDLFNEHDTCFYLAQHSPYNVGVRRRWDCYPAALARLTNALAEASTGHLGAGNYAGTPLSDAVTLRVEPKLGGFVRRFANQQWNISAASADVEEVSHAELHRASGYDMTSSPRKSAGSPAAKGDFCLLNVDHAALPDEGAAGTCVLTELLGEDHPLLQPETLLDPDRPSLEELRTLKAVAHCEAGHWPRICARMKRSTMIKYAETSAGIAQNSVFGIRKTGAKDAPHRFINAAGAANLCWKSGCGKVLLPHPDLLTRVRLAQGSRLRGAACDVDQCYNRMRVPSWMQAYLGLPSVWSTDVGVEGPARWVVPVMTVLPMGIAPAVRICQAAVETVVRRAGPCRVFNGATDLLVSDERPPLDVVYLDDVVTLGPDEVATNRRNDAIAAALADAGLPTKKQKNRRADNSAESCEALGLCWWADGFITPSVPRLEKLKLLADAILASGEASPREMAAAVGTAISCCVLRRPLLSVLFAVFRFTALGEYDTSRRVPVGALRELSTLLDLAPVMGHTLQPLGANRVYFTDASPYGAGVVYAPDTSARERAVLEEKGVQNLWQPAHHEEMECTQPADATARKWTVSASFRDFFSSRPFTVAISSQWRRGAHINVLELEALLLALRHGSSAQSFDNSALKFGLDSAVALGVLRKGRSSAFALNAVARKICAVTIAGNLWPEYFWTPTDLQPADEPSRRFPVLDVKCLQTHSGSCGRATPSVSA